MYSTGRDRKAALPTQANWSQVHNFDGVGYCLAAHLGWVGSSWLELYQAQIFVQLEPGFPPFGLLSQLSPSCVLLLCDYVVVFRQLNGFLQSGSTWRCRLVTRRCKFRFCNLARVGLSWENRLARAFKGIVHTFFNMLSRKWRSLFSCGKWNCMIATFEEILTPSTGR